jgi:hypothetical protein
LIFSLITSFIFYSICFFWVYTIYYYILEKIEPVGFGNIGLTTSSTCSSSFFANIWSNVIFCPFLTPNSSKSLSNNILSSAAFYTWVFSCGTSTAVQANYLANGIFYFCSVFSGDSGFLGDGV